MKLSECIDKIKRGLCWAEIIVWFVWFKFHAAAGTVVLVIACVDPSKSQFRLNVPVAVENPAVAVSNPGSSHPSLVTIVAKFAEIRAKKLEIQRQIAEIVYSA